MQLTDTTKKELKNILREYQMQDKIVDEKFINDIMEILNEDSRIDGKLKYEVGRKFIIAKSKFIDGKNYFDVNGIRLFVAKFPGCYYEFFDESYDGIIANIFAMYYILNDAVKMTNRLGLTGYEELDRAYHDFYQRIDNLTKRQYAKYLRNNKDAIVNRNPRIEAFRELLDITILSDVRIIPEVQYTDSLVKGYENGIISPMHNDFDYLGLDFDKYDFSKIPFLDSLEQGITEDGENITMAGYLRKEYLEGKESFDEIYKELKKV